MKSANQVVESDLQSPYCRSGPKSNRSGPRSGDYVKRLGLAAALKNRLGSAYLSGGSLRSSGPPKSALHAHSIKEEAESVETLHKRDDSAEEKNIAAQQPSEEAAHPPNSA